MKVATSLPKGNCYRIIERLIRKGKIKDDPGNIQNVVISHDAWCGIYSAKDCNCNPEIHLNGKRLR